MIDVMFTAGGFCLGAAVVALAWGLVELYRREPAEAAAAAAMAAWAPAADPATDWGLLAAKALDLHIERTDAARAWAAEHGTGGAR